MDDVEELRTFLRSRRARLAPKDVGLLYESRGRRSPGLRREEVALLAGISADYYARIERGRARDVSDQVVQSLARALNLDDVEHEHLRRLTGPRPLPAPATPLSAPPEINALVAAVDPVPAMAHTRAMDVVAANTAARTLLDGLTDQPEERRNFARWLFLDARARVVFPDWEESARETAGTLRGAATDPGEPAAHALVDELVSASEEFLTLWKEHAISRPRGFGKVMHHPATGDLDLIYQSLPVPQHPGLYVTLYFAAPGSHSAEILPLLRQ